MPRGLRFALLFLALLLFPVCAHADDDVRSLRLRYEAPERCPTRAWLEGTLHFRSSRIVPALDTDPAPFEASVVVSAAPEHGYRGTMRIAPHGGVETTREVEGQSCQTVVDALSLAIAILLDPDGMNAESLPSETELTRLAEAARAKLPAPPKRESAPPPSTPSADPADPVERARLELLAEIGAGAWTAVEGLAPRAHLAVELRSERARLSLFGRLGGFVQPEGAAPSSAGEVTYLPLGGRIDGGALLGLARGLRLGAGLHVTTLVMAVDAPTADERRGSVRVVPGIGPLVRASWEPAAFGVALDLAGGAHLLRERYRIDGTPSGEVFRLPLFWLQATLGVVVRFRDL